MLTKNVTFKSSTLFIFLGLFVSTLFMTATSEAKTKKSKKGSKARVMAKTSKAQQESDRNQMLKRQAPDQKVGVIKQNLSTDMTFNDLNLTGKRQSPFGSQVTVEDEKGIPSLVDYRKNFKDRAEQTQFGR